MNRYLARRYEELKILLEEYGVEYYNEIVSDYEALVKDIVSRVEKTGRVTNSDLQMFSSWMLAVSVTHQKAIRTQLKELATEAYLRSIYTLDTATGESHIPRLIDMNKIDLLMDKKWYNGNWKSRTWYQEGIVGSDDLAEILKTAAIEGWDPYKLSKELGDNWVVPMSKRMKTIIRSEAAFIGEQATLLSYQDKGIKKYRFLNSLEKNTCSVCGDLGDKTFEVEEAVVGDNYPPIHGNCRCTTIPDVELSENTVRWSKNPETGENEIIPFLTYDEWKKTVKKTKQA